MQRFLLIVMVFNGLLTFGQTQGPNNPASASNSFAGCLSCPGGEWNPELNIRFADLAYAEVSLTSYPTCFQTSCYYSRSLLISGFGFTIPSNATILGVEAQVLRKTNAASGMVDSSIRLFSSNYAVGMNNASAASWPLTPAMAGYGGSNDLWGYTLTADTINSTGFGIAILAKFTGVTPASFVTASIDHVTLTVYYSTGTGIQSQVREPTLSIDYNKLSHSLVMNGNLQVKSLRVFNLVGKTVFQHSGFRLASGETNGASITLPALADGVYFVRVEADGKSSTRRFVVN